MASNISLGIKNYPFNGYHISIGWKKIQFVDKRFPSTAWTYKKPDEFVPGEPYVFFYDPDGYEVEV